MAQMSSEEMSRHAEQEPRLPERSAGSSERLRMGSPIRDYKSQSKTPAANARKRTRAGEARIDSEAGYRRLFEAAQDGILILNAKTGVIVDVNPFMTKLLGYARSYFLDSPKRLAA